MWYIIVSRKKDLCFKIVLKRMIRKEARYLFLIGRKNSRVYFVIAMFLYLMIMMRRLVSILLKVNTFTYISLVEAKLYVI